MIAFKEKSPDACAPDRRRFDWGLALSAGFIIACAASFLANTRKVPPARPRSPRETWHDFGRQFERYSTPVITPHLLAALAQVESGGDPQARPAAPSSAAGLMQMTDGNFETARRFARRGVSYSRLEPSDAVELTAAYLDAQVEEILAQAGRKISIDNRHRLATVVHLCGPEKGKAFVDLDFDVGALGSCGEQPVAPYVRRVMRYRTEFSQCAADEPLDG